MMILLVISDLVTLVMQEDELRRADPVEFFEGQCVFFRESLTSFGYLWMTSCSPGEPLPDLPVTSFFSVNMAEVSTAGAPFPVL
jgi:hypothetical protein